MDILKSIAVQECEVSKGGKLQCVSDCFCIFCYTEIKGQVTSLPALRERYMYLPRQLHRASYSWECNALPVTTLVYPLKAWKVTWHLETATHTFASPALPSPASSFTVHWAHLHRFVPLLLNWKLLQPGSASLCSERGVTNTTRNSAQTQIKVQPKGHLPSRPAGRRDCTPRQQGRRQLLIKSQAEMLLSGPVEEQGVLVKATRCTSDVIPFPLVWHVARRELAAACNHKP